MQYQVMDLFKEHIP